MLRAMLREPVGGPRPFLWEEIETVAASSPASSDPTSTPGANGSGGRECGVVEFGGGGGSGDLRGGRGEERGGVVPALFLLQRITIPGSIQQQSGRITTPMKKGRRKDLPMK